MFFRLKPLTTIAVFTVLAAFPYAVFSLHNKHLYYLLFDWLGFFDLISPIPLFLATGNFLIIRKSGNRVIPTIAAAVVGWAFLTEISWGMELTPLKNCDIIQHTGFMPFVSWIDDLTLYTGTAYILSLPLIHQLKPLKEFLIKKGFPFPSTEMILSLIPICLLLIYLRQLPYHGNPESEMPEFLSALWIYFVSSQEGAKK